MRIRERGVGNMAFIAVLILFVVAAAMAFVWKDQGDTLGADNAELRQKNNDLTTRVAQAGQAYDAVVGTFGVGEITNKIQRQGGYKTPAEIQKAVSDWVLKVQEELKTASVATVQGNQWTVSGDGGLVKIETEQGLNVQYYTNEMGPETATVQELFRPIPEAFRTACKHVKEATDKYEEQYVAAEEAESAKNTTLANQSQEHQEQISTIKSAQESADAERRNLQDEVTRLTAKVDSETSRKEAVKAEMARKERESKRELQAHKDRIANIKKEHVVALAEDPKDGQVVLAEPRRLVCYIDLGRENKVRPGMEFTVWRAGKGNQRQNLAEIRVIDVKESMSTCSIIEVLNSRVPVSKGHNISNPFYSPIETLRVFISGNLQRYDSATAKRRLAAEGVEISRVLDDRVDVIVLGDPDVSAATGDEYIDPDDPEAMKALKAREEALRERRLNEVLEKARAIGAVVVTEDVLSTFISW